MSKLSDLLNPVLGTPPRGEVSVVAADVQESSEPFVAHPVIGENHPELVSDSAVYQQVNPNTVSATPQGSVTPDDQTNNQANPSPLPRHSHPFQPNTTNQPQPLPPREPEQALTDISSLRVTLPPVERISEPSTRPGGSDLKSDDAPVFQQSKHDATEVENHPCPDEAIEATSPTTEKRMVVPLITAAVPFRINTHDLEPAQGATPTVTSPEAASFLNAPPFPPGERRRVGARVKGVAKRASLSSKRPQTKKQKTTKGVSKASAAASSTNDSTPSAPASSSPLATSASEDGGEDGVDLFCICRGPDDHTRMICCDSCDDWFHIRCVNINEERADIIDKYICPNCHNDENFTTYKPLCRLPGCPQPARVEQKSKYCRDEHGREFMRRQTQETTTVPGGSLSLEELASIVQQTDNQEEFARLGAAHPHDSQPVALEQNDDPKSEVKDELTEGIPHSHRYTNEEWARVGYIRWERQQLLVRSDLLRDKERLFQMIDDQVQAEAKRAGLPNICGFDNRLCWSVEEFAAWRATEIGRRALKESSLPHDRQPRVLASGRAAPMSLSVCYDKRCLRHQNWETVHSRAIRHELLYTVEQDKSFKLELDELDDRARVRKQLEVGGGPGGTVEILDDSVTYY